MPQYFEVTEHELQDARPGLLLVERLLDADSFTPCLYALTTKQDVLLAAQAALEDDAGDGSPAPQLTEVAIAIQFSSDALGSLAGSGLPLQNEEFAFLAPDEGARTLSLRWGGQRPRIHIGDFSVMALADSDMYLDDFLSQHAQQPQEAGDAPREGAVQRSEVQAVRVSAKAGPKRVARRIIANTHEIDRFLQD